MTHLFNYGAFALHSGDYSDFKIDCDALVDEDWESLASIICDAGTRFSAVEGVPDGGLPLAAALRAHTACYTGGGLLIVDDVLTTGASMEEQRAGRDAIGYVVFARGECPDWVRPMSKWIWDIGEEQDDGE